MRVVHCAVQRVDDPRWRVGDEILFGRAFGVGFLANEAERVSLIVAYESKLIIIM